ncbi:MAG: divergent polysaccharide deacetylase family protein [Hyphomonadaceae bacterium]|nr:divergent polysaccharide deacetylase family protein [Hyphomonadaceae bacterium]
MSSRIARDPSPFRSGLVHSALGAFTLTFVLGSGATAMHVMGDADAAGPTVRMALFDETPSDAPQLNPRLPGYQEAIGFAQAGTVPAAPQPSTDEPDLGVEYDGAVRMTASASTSQQPTGIRINGKTVLPGQTYSQINQIGDADAAPTPGEIASKMVQIGAGIADDSPLAKNARAFSNPDGKPTVSLIVSGLGTNATRTRAAINELPPEVTLSFAPTSDNLRTWVRQARRAGHEVLIELPMEPYDYGRQRPHAQVMQVGVSADTNRQRLSKLLARAPGYVGVMNYQGAKFATEQAAVDPVVAELRAKGLAFFEDGSLIRSEFEGSSRNAGLAFGKATAWVDARPVADEISQQLLVLETTARERGAALGTSMPFPVSIDLLKEWIPTLEEKGIALAPASYYAKRSLSAGQTQQARLDPQG